MRVTSFFAAVNHLRGPRRKQQLKGQRSRLSVMIGKFPSVSHVLNEQGTGYEFLKSIELKNGPLYLKEQLKISKLTKFESYWFKGKSMVPF